jgi:CheY-like chemotaxis protein
VAAVDTVPVTPVRVLVVDDVEDAAETAAVLLRAEGYDVRTARNMDAAIQLVRKFVPQVAVLDIVMPGGDGLQLARYLRLFHPDCRLVAISGMARPADQRRSREAGFEQHLAKPCAPESLIGAIRALH